MLEQQIVVTSLFKYGGYFKKREGDNNNYYLEQTGKHQWNDWLAKYWQYTVVSECKGIIGLVQGRR